MTEILFSESTAVAMDFAARLFAGTLNVHPDYDQDGSPMVERTAKHHGLNSDNVELARLQFLEHRISRLVVRDVMENTDDTQEFRAVTLYAKRTDNQIEVRAAEFDLYRDFLDGERAVGWTRWYLRNVTIFTEEGLPFNLCWWVLPSDEVIWINGE